MNAIAASYGANQMTTEEITCKHFDNEGEGHTYVIFGMEITLCFSCHNELIKQIREQVALEAILA